MYPQSNPRPSIGGIRFIADHTWWNGRYVSNSVKINALPVYRKTGERQNFGLLVAILRAVFFVGVNWGDIGEYCFRLSDAGCCFGMFQILLVAGMVVTRCFAGDLQPANPIDHLFQEFTVATQKISQ